jgi:anamorsin
MSLVIELEKENKNIEGSTIHSIKSDLFTTYKDESFETIQVNCSGKELTKDLSNLFKILKREGSLIFKDDFEGLDIELMLNGFSDIKEENGSLKTKKPKSENLSYSIKTKEEVKVTEKKVFTLNLEDDINEEMINEDDLLEPDDFNVSKKVCATTGKRKACKDCSCGLSEELEDESKKSKKSSCGSCGLGDAFRCSTCPHLGTPAFDINDKTSTVSLKDL